MTDTATRRGVKPRTESGKSARGSGSPLLKLTLKRLLMVIPLLLAVSVLVFILLEMMPGDPARNQAGMEATEAQVEALREQMGLNRSPVERYLEWLFGFFRGDLGTSTISRESVAHMLLDRSPITIELVVLAFVVSLGIAIPVALLAARRPGGLFDRACMVVSMTMLAVPNFVLAMLLVLVFGVMLRLLPAIGFVPLGQDIWLNLRSVILPVLALAVPLAAFYTRFLRGDLVEQMNSADYVDTARAKGVRTGKVLWKHAFRNSSFGLLTIVGLNIGTLVGGTVIIEQIFAMPGLGMMMLNGAMSQDVAVVQACVFIFAAVAILANLFVDLMYAVLDPRIRYGSH